VYGSKIGEKSSPKQRLPISHFNEQVWNNLETIFIEGKVFNLSFYKNASF